MVEYYFITWSLWSHDTSIPYILGEQLQRVLRSHRVPWYHKPFNSEVPVGKPLGQDPERDSVKCGRCRMEYIGETARTLRVRFKKHIDSKHPKSAITEHTSITGHKYTLADVKVLVKEDNDFKKKVKEAIAIHKNKPVLNRDRCHEIPLILLQLMSCDQSGHVTK